jgi:hypothetical protein
MISVYADAIEKCEEIDVDPIGVALVMSDINMIFI